MQSNFSYVQYCFVINYLLHVFDVYYVGFMINIDRLLSMIKVHFSVPVTSFAVL